MKKRTVGQSNAHFHSPVNNNITDSVDSTVIRNTIVTETLIIHELDNRLLDAVCLDTEDNSVPSLERSLDTLSDKGDVSEQGNTSLLII